MTATLVLTNGHITTMEPARPRATAIALRGDRILALGGDDEMRALLGPGGEWIDLKGRGVTPGLVDAHVHFQHYALSLQRVDLDNASSTAEVLARVAGFLNRPGGSPDGWLQGRGWQQDAWADRAFPGAADLDALSSNRPIFLTHKSGHAAWVNSAALRLAGVGPATPDPAGGKIERDEDGQPTGILFEDAIDLVAGRIPRPTVTEIAAAMRAAQERCWRAGLTGLHDFDGRDCFQALQLLREDGELGLRVVKNLPVYRLDHALGLGIRSGFGDAWLRIGGVKIFADGALGSKTAAMLAPYENEPDNLGIVVTEKEEMIEKGRQAAAAGLSLTIHAIGDRANHDVLDVFEVLRREETAGGGRLRHRIEHVQVLHPADLNRLARLDIIASMQPIHATSDMLMADRSWGSRARNSYAWRSLLESGALLVFGSDAPVEPIEPLPGLHAAVSRRRPDGSPGPDGWYPEQRLTMAEALRAFTAAAALTAGQEREQGTLAPGKLADLTICSRDLLETPPDELPDVTVDGTIVGGVFRYRSIE
jgi:hypothetical protein